MRVFSHLPLVLLKEQIPLAADGYRAADIPSPGVMLGPNAREGEPDSSTVVLR